jgi:hypothetical protein
MEIKNLHHCNYNIGNVWTFHIYKNNKLVYSMEEQVPKIMYDEIEFDSEEERMFYLYCEELQEAGFIKRFTFHDISFTLSEKVTYEWIKKLKTKENKTESTLLQPHIYSPDFWIEWDCKAYNKFYLDIHDGKNKLDSVPFINNIDNNGNDIGSYIEIKPSFDMNNMTRLFVINSKWMYQEHRIYVQKIIPIGKKNCLFANTFVPQKAMFTLKTNKPKKYKFETKSLEQYVMDF